MKRKFGVKLMGGLMAAALAMPAVQGAGANGGLARVCAVEFTVTAADAVLYATGSAKVYAQPDAGTKVITVIAENLPVQVTGITSNGWFQISLEGTFYIPGDGLVSRNVGDSNGVVSGTDVMGLTRGTFSFYDNSQLSKFDKDDIEGMDENTYIKYLDSFLMGYAMLDYCILQDSGKLLKEVYDNEAKADKNVAAMSMQTYLIHYRNNYLSNSLAGPFRSEKDLKRALNRAIRYNIGTFGAVYKNSGVGSSEEKIKKLMEGVVNQMKAEQGVSFTCRMEYGEYTTGDGDKGKGWIIEFTKKD